MAYHNGDCLSDNVLLRNIQTSARNPLNIIQCYCYFQIEDGQPEEHLCNPNSSVIESKPISEYINSIKGSPYVLYHNGERLQIRTLLKSFCVTENPIKIKCLQLKILVDGSVCDIDIKGVVLFNDLILKTATTVGHQIKQVAYDSTYSEVENLDQFILRTDIN